MKPINFEIPRRAAPGYINDILEDRFNRKTVEKWKDIPPGHRFLIFFHGMADKGKVEYNESDKELKRTLNQAKEAADWDIFKRHNPNISQSWVPLKDGKHHALSACNGMGGIAREFLRALSNRQTALTGPEDWGREAVLISPLATGLGNPHPVENGFAFLTPYGIPYIAGSGVKGVLRRAAEELALFHHSNQAGEGISQHGWTLAHVWSLFGFDENSAFFSSHKKPTAPEWLEAYVAWVERVSDEGSDLLEVWTDAIRSQLSEKFQMLGPVEFLKALPKKENQPLRRAIHWQGMISFKDAFPDERAELAVDILNPHHKKYYEGKGTPHDAENPVPVLFLTLAPGASFDFRCNALLGRDDLWPKIGNWKPLMDAAFDYACGWLGFGAKTAVGYGQFVFDEKAQKNMDLAKAVEEERLKKAVEEVVKRQKEERQKTELEAMSPEERDIALIRSGELAEDKVVEIYKGIDNFSEERKADLALVLKEYWIKFGKWEGKQSNKQQIKILKIKEILASN